MRRDGKATACLLVSLVELGPLNAAVFKWKSPAGRYSMFDFWARWITWSSILQTGYGITKTGLWNQFLIYSVFLRALSTSLTAMSSVSAPGLDCKDAKICLPSRTEKELSCCHGNLVGGTWKQPWQWQDLSAASSCPPNGIKMFWSFGCVTNLKQKTKTSPLRMNEGIVIMKEKRNLGHKSCRYEGEMSCYWQTGFWFCMFFDGLCFILVS